MYVNRISINDSDYHAFSHEIYIKPTAEILTWCEDNLHGNYRIVYSSHREFVIEWLEFDETTDYILFKMFWK